MKKNFSFSALIFAALLIIIISAGKSARADEVVLQDDSLLVAFDSNSGALPRLERKSTHWMIDRRAELGVSFRLHVPLPDRRYNFVLGQKQHANKVEKISENEARFQWKNLVSEQAGIVGSRGAVYSTVTVNTIHDIHVRKLFSGVEMAGIKIHAAIAVSAGQPRTSAGKLAVEELRGYFAKIFTNPVTVSERADNPVVVLGTPESNPLIQQMIKQGKISLPQGKNADQGYAIKTVEKTVCVAASTEVGMLYGVYALLEEYGAYFQISGDCLPPRAAFQPKSLNICLSPVFKYRGIMPWDNFLCGSSGYNEEDWQELIMRATRMKLNKLDLHFYPGDDRPMLLGAGWCSLAIPDVPFAKDALTADKWKHVVMRAGKIIEWQQQLLEEDQKSIGVLQSVLPSLPPAGKSWAKLLINRLEFRSIYLQATQALNRSFITYDQISNAQGIQAGAKAAKKETAQAVKLAAEAIEKYAEDVRNRGDLGVIGQLNVQFYDIITQLDSKFALDSPNVTLN